MIVWIPPLLPRRAGKNVFTEKELVRSLNIGLSLGIILPLLILLLMYIWS